MGLDDLFDAGLPMNRKERFFTGTVFPMLTCRNAMQELHLLLARLGVEDAAIDGTASGTNVQVFTEYCLKESVFTQDDHGRFSTDLVDKSTPDVVIYVGPPRQQLVLIEAKVYDRPTAAQLIQQIKAQKAVGDVMASGLGIDPDAVIYAALLPGALAAEIGDIPVPVVTWENLLELYPGPDDYWVQLLKRALDLYPTLAAPGLSFGANADTKLTGVEIVAAIDDDEPRWLTMGRSGGLRGPKLDQDVASGGWRTQRYECSSRPDPINANWFTVAEFVARVHAQGSAATGEGLPPDP